MSTSREVRRGGIRWHVETSGEGPTLLLLHGTGASSHSFRALSPLLSARFTIVAPDLPGHGKTRAPSWFESSLPSFAAAVDELLVELDARPAVVAGHSAGAAVLARMILDRSVAPSLFVGLAAALLPLRGLSRKLLPRAARALSIAATLGLVGGIGSPARVARLLRSTGSTLGAEGVAAYADLFQHREHVGAVLSMMAGWSLDALWDELPALNVETLLLAGADDRAVPLGAQHAAAARLPRARVSVVTGAGHLLHEERPAVVADLVLRAAEEETRDEAVRARSGGAAPGVRGGDGAGREGDLVAPPREADPRDAPSGVRGASAHRD